MSPGESLISIALCTYNGERFLSEQLDSILSQTYSNIEIVAVDDCSTDKSYHILEEYASRDPRIRVFRNDVNIGFNKNFERAIKLTTGEYIAISDQDDIWRPEKLKVLKENIGNNWLIFSNSALIDIYGKPMGGLLLSNFSFSHISYKSFLNNNLLTGHTTLFKREFIEYLFPLPHEGYYDWYMGFVAIYHRRLTYLGEVLTFYRIHPDSVIQQSQSKESRSQNFSLKLVQLKIFCRYSNLHAEDRLFLEKYTTAFSLQKRQFSFSMMRIILRYYSQLFQKKRSLLSIVNFAVKRSKKVS